MKVFFEIKKMERNLDDRYAIICMTNIDFNGLIKFIKHSHDDCWEK